MKRRYEELLKQHFSDDSQMAFVSGPRQVGKTTTASAFALENIYLSWDNDDDRMAILDGPAAVKSRIGLSSTRTVIFDELHKYPHWNRNEEIQDPKHPISDIPYETGQEFSGFPVPVDRTVC